MHTQQTQYPKNEKCRIVESCKWLFLVECGLIDSYTKQTLAKECTATF